MANSSSRAGFCLDIRLTSCSLKPLARSATRNSPKPSGGSGLPIWPRSDDRMQNSGPILRMASANLSMRALASADFKVPPTNSMKAPSFAASCICAMFISTGSFMACVTTMCCTLCRRPSLSGQQALGRRGMARRQHEVVLGDEADHLFHRRQQFAVLRHADERPVLLRIAHLVLGVEGRKPHHPSPAAGHARHVLHGHRIDAADGEVEVDAAEHLNAGHHLPHQVHRPGRGLEVVLEDDRAHLPLRRELGHVDGVDRPGPIVRQVVHVDVDGAGQQARPRCHCAALRQKRRGRPQARRRRPVGSCGGFYAKQSADFLGKLVRRKRLLQELRAGLTTPSGRSALVK